jgi:hypothetical protein
MDTAGMDAGLIAIVTDGGQNRLHGGERINAARRRVYSSSHVRQ